MYRISEAAEKVGVSRTSILYYEKLKLISSERQENGYRIYREADIQRIKLLLQLQSAGLTLKECKSCFESKVDRGLLESRLKTLDEDIMRKQKSRELLVAILGGEGIKKWHLEANQYAPDAHFEWLVRQGFNEKEAFQLKWLSRNMNTHEQYMLDFMTVYEKLDRWGPGSETDTLKAFSLLPYEPKSILEIGCGKGLTTLLLSKNTSAKITAIDNEPSAVDFLSSRIKCDGLNTRITPLCASMTEIPFENSTFDLILAEGSAYIMGVTNALNKWKPLLKKDGILIFSDLVWLTNTPSKEAKAYFENEYPDMQMVETRKAQATKAGYKVIDSFKISDLAWSNYYNPLIERVRKLSPQMKGSAAINDIQIEIDIYNKFLGEYGYQMYILKS